MKTVCCAGCRKRLLARRPACRPKEGAPPAPAGRLAGRPYCASCLLATLRWCNCAGCGAELAVRPAADRLETILRALPHCPLWVAGRVAGRPYCCTCLRWRSAEFRQRLTEGRAS